MSVLCGIDLLLLGETIRTVPTQLDILATTTMKIHFNITFDALACEDANVHSMDTHGNQVFDTRDTVMKTSLRLDGTPILGRNESVQRVPPIDKHDYNGGNNDVPKRMTQGEGCNLAGYLNSYRVGGNFHIAMGSCKQGLVKHVHQFDPSDRPNFHVSHMIHYLHLDGEAHGVLDGTRAFVNARNGTTGTFQYYLTVIPIRRETHESNRYILSRKRFVPLFNTTLLSGQHVNNILPGVFFILEMNLFSEVVEQRRFGVKNILWLILLTGAVVVSALCLDELFFGARRRLLERRRTRARMLVVV